MSQLLSTISSSLFSAGFAIAVLNYVRDRRSAKAKAIVAEQTIGVEVDAARLANMDQRLTLVEKAHDAETEALQATIKNLKERLDSATGRITLLEQRVEFEDTRYRAAIRYIRALRAWINRQIPGVDAPAIPAALEVDFDD